MSISYVTDGGLETDLIFRRGIALPEFAAFPLLETDDGRRVLRDYYLDYATIAARAEASLLLEAPTWRANLDHATALGFGPAQLDAINRRSIDLLTALAREREDELVGWAVGGTVGPRGDGYGSAGPTDPDQAAEYHRPQLASFRAAGADRATALTLTDVGEGIGITRAAQDVGIPVAIGFTVETDGRLPDGTPLGGAIETVDVATGSAPAYFVINCAHPSHITAGLDVDEGNWHSRVGCLRVNASALSHAELDDADVLDDGDPQQLAVDQAPLLRAFTELRVLGGCCGTDARHVAAMWGVPFT